MNSTRILSCVIRDTFLAIKLERERKGGREGGRERRRGRGRGRERESWYKEKRRKKRMTY